MSTGVIMNRDTAEKKSSEANGATNDEIVPHKHEIPFYVYKFFNIALLLIPFIVCWFSYYEGKTTSNGLVRVSILIFMFFSAIFYYTCQKLDGFRVSIKGIGEIISSQILSVAVTDLIVFILIWTLSFTFPNLIPGLLAFLIQCFLIIAWSIIMNKWYIRTHKPFKTAIVYDMRRGMEAVFQEHGMEKRFDIQSIFQIEDVLESIEVLDGFEAVFLCGIHSKERNVILKYCINSNIKLYIIPRIGDVMMAGAEQMHMLHLPILRCQRGRTSAEYRFCKRAMDIIISGIAIIILSPILLLTALLVKSDGGPALYKQVRLTKDGRKFKILKFRSMIVDAEKYSGAVLSSGENDPRITKIGRIIRACRIDELHQLINILKGDRSIVGSIPERREIAAEYEKYLPEFSLRLQVKAGLTGYAQVYGKYNTTPYDKLLMDLMYIAKPSIVEDIMIMIATVKILFMPESTEGISEGQTTAMSGENH